jgi:hypothetical protein
VKAIRVAPGRRDVAQQLKDWRRLSAGLATFLDRKMKA